MIEVSITVVDPASFFLRGGGVRSPLRSQQTNGTIQDHTVVKVKLTVF